MQDKTLPTAPKVNVVSDQEKTVTGTVGATITVKAGSKTYKGTAKANETFTVAVGVQKAGTVLNRNGNRQSK